MGEAEIQPSLWQLCTLISLIKYGKLRENIFKINFTVSNIFNSKRCNAESRRDSLRLQS